MDEWELWSGAEAGAEPSDVDWTAGFGTDAEGGLLLGDGGRIWDLGPADLDVDADGVPDSRSTTGPDGLTIYSDSDKDGRVDVIIRVAADGSYITSLLGGDGLWATGDVGRFTPGG